MSPQSTALGTVAATPAEPRRFAGRALKAFLLSILLGPPLGGWIFFTVIVLAKGDIQNLRLEAIGPTVIVSGLTGYFVGLIRAVPAGGWVAYKVWRDGTIGYLETAAAAAVVSLVVGLRYLAYAYEPMGSAATMGLVFGALAILAALIC